MKNQKYERLNLDNIGFFTRLFSSKFRMYLRELRHQHYRANDPKSYRDGRRIRSLVAPGEKL